MANAFKYGRSSFLATIFVVLASALTAILTDLPAKEPYVDSDHDEEVDYTHELKEIYEMIQSGHLTIIGLKLGVTKVDEIERRLGKIEDPLIISGDHHSLRHICYVSDRQADTSKLILGVDPEGFSIGFYPAPLRPV